MALNLLAVVFVVMVTWLVHSSLLLGGAALLSRVHRNMSPRQTEWLWKTAILLPCLTTAIQCSSPQALALWQWELASPVEAKTPLTSEREIAAVPEPQIPLSTSNDTPKVATEWQMEILPEDPPAIAEKPHDHKTEIANGPVPPPFSLELDREPDLQFSVAPALKKSQRTATEQQNPPTEGKAAKQSNPPTQARPISEPATGTPWFVPFGVGVMIVMGMIGGGRFIWLFVTTRKVTARARPLSAGLAYHELQQLLTRHGKTIEIQLVESDAISIPAAGGLFRRRIYLPRNIESRFDPEEVQALLAHELGHHVRGDVWWLWLGRVACHLLPWQPLLLLAVRRWQQAAEPLCDDWAIARNIHPVTLAKSLTQVAQCHLTQPLLGPAAAQGPSQLTFRVKRLLENKPEYSSRLNRHWLVAITMVVASGVIVGAPAILLPSDENPDQARTTDSVRIGQENRGDKSKEPQPKAADSEKPSPTAAISPDSHQPASVHPIDPSSTSLPPDILRELTATTADLNRMLRLLQKHKDNPELQEAANQLRRRLDRLRSNDLIDREFRNRQTPK